MNQNWVDLEVREVRHGVAPSKPARAIPQSPFIILGSAFLALAVSIPVALAVSLTIWGLSYRRWRKWWGRNLAESGE